MIAERLPQLASMSLEEKWEVYLELDEELHPLASSSDDPQLNDPETVSAVKELLEARMAHYRENPESALPWEEVRSRLKDRFENWKAGRLKSA